ncbi:hypothetical protein CSUB01_02647 [Colletotrichum sublineola]|uniref:Uncharacterized protein n=1 Tax=Colletotrichum sublineola TaxID=1173701 RepID=A0A066Y135_COLSU|nr:hypothetical protein CSUB01_02647 [Colletotrichum sublineola]
MIFGNPEPRGIESWMMAMYNSVSQALENLAAVRIKKKGSAILRLTLPPVAPPALSFPTTPGALPATNRSRGDTTTQPPVVPSPLHTLARVVRVSVVDTIYLLYLQLRFIRTELPLLIGQTPPVRLSPAPWKDTPSSPYSLNRQLLPFFPPAALWTAAFKENPSNYPTRASRLVYLAQDPVGPATRIDVVLQPIVPSSPASSDTQYVSALLAATPNSLDCRPAAVVTSPKSQALPGQILVHWLRSSTIFLAASSPSSRRFDHCHQSTNHQQSTTTSPNSIAAEGEPENSHQPLQRPLRPRNTSGHSVDQQLPDMRNSIFQPPRGHLAHLVFFASAATAAIISIGDSSLSLSNFQLITELSVPLGCLLAYNTPISGCQVIDFDSRRTCSAQCAAQHHTWTSTGRQPSQRTLRYHESTNVIASTDHQIHHYDLGTASDHHRPAAAAVTTTTATANAATSDTTTGVFYFGSPTAAAAAAANDNINTVTGSTSAVAATAAANTTSIESSATASTAASANKHCHFCNHVSNHIRTQGYF